MSRNGTAMSEYDMEKRVDKLEESMHQMAVVQAEQNVILKNVLDFIQRESDNSASIKVLQNNWNWLKWMLGGTWIPLLFLLLREVIK